MRTNEKAIAAGLPPSGVGADAAWTIGGLCVTLSTDVAHVAREAAMLGVAGEIKLIGVHPIS